MKETIIIIPAYNEAEKIGFVLDRVSRCAANFADILVIDDGSLDQTSKAASQAGAAVISLPFNMGYGTALETGYKYAYNKGYQYLIQMDGDGQHEPECINDLLEALKKGQADIVIGSRYLKDCGYKTTLARKIGSFIFSKIASFFSKKRITDPTTGFQAMNSQVVKFFVAGFYPSDYPDADVLIILNKAGFRIEEIPVIMYSKNNAKSMHAGLIKPMYYIFKMFLSIGMIFLRKKQVK